MSHSQEYVHTNLDLLYQLKSLALNLSHVQNNKEFVNILKQIISSSKLEGNVEIEIITTSLKNVIELIIMGNVSLDGDSQDLIVDTLRNMEDYLRDGKKINAEIFDKLKSLEGSRFLKDDYIITKSLTVLFVDADKFSQVNIKQNSPESIKYVLCSSGQEARQQLETKTFDALLCETDLPDMDGIELIKQFSSKMPVIALLTSDNSKQIQNILKAGAMDCVVKNSDSQNIIPRLLHAASYSWNKSAEPTDNKKLLRDTDTLTILNNLMKSDDPIRERIISKIGYDKEVNDIIQKQGGKLDALVDAGFVIKKPTGLSVSCPKCKSVDLTSLYTCQNCNGCNFTKQRLLEHYECGNISPEISYSEHMCPKCNKEIKAIGVDYKIMDDYYTCNECDNIFTELHHTFICNNDDKTVFNLTDAQWTALYQYKVNEKKLDEIKGNAISLESIKNFLVERGFNVTLEYKMKGKFQDATYDLVASKDFHHVVIVILGSSVEEYLLKLEQVEELEKNLKGTVSKFCILFSTPSETITNVIYKYGISPIIVPEKSLILDKFKEKIIL